MELTLLRAKIHRARVTDANLEYQGSISICPELLDISGLLPWERVDVYNLTNGQRFSTYIIKGGRGEICLNGAAARLAQPGDQVIIAAYCTMGAEQARNHRPAVVLVDDRNHGTLAEDH
ncbi:aspartate 1-decarboxylase [Spirochaeta lutea]|uniref:Aspartate 1-decarboxylase n=1 Tax=Spirochaeta lutea TaxID=1480694 RepID=A0A098QZW2_9SPIO|nr:aspartate 1-decarboxylase [Spirochaeta lutea]KGE73405.1 hypothetical protein DC28_03800 [Spirochaeta lutea]